MQLTRLALRRSFVPMRGYLLNYLRELEIRIAGWMESYLGMLRVSVALVFIWFGGLKPFGLSPAEELVIRTTDFLFDPSWFLPVLGWWEVAIGLCLLWQRAIPLGLVLLFLQMPGTMLRSFSCPRFVGASFRMH